MLHLLSEVIKRCPGRKLPDDYLVIDTETSGLDIANDFIVQVGLCFVVGRKKQSGIAQIINRPGLNMHRRAMEVNRITPERMEKEGVLAQDFIPSVLDILGDNMKKGGFLVGHNLATFDLPLLRAEAARFQRGAAINPNLVIDTGGLVKSAQMGVSPLPGETLLDFWSRVASIRARGVYWSMQHCYEAYGLGKYGIPLEKAHDAGVDAELAHFLFEEFKLMAAKEAV